MKGEKCQDAIVLENYAWEIASQCCQKDRIFSPVLPPSGNTKDTIDSA
jgi:hypothetical protein